MNDIAPCVKRKIKTIIYLMKGKTSIINNMTDNSEDFLDQSLQTE